MSDDPTPGPVSTEPPALPGTVPADPAGTEGPPLDPAAVLDALEKRIAAEKPAVPAGEAVEPDHQAPA